MDSQVYKKLSKDLEKKIKSDEQEANSEKIKHVLAGIDTNLEALQAKNFSKDAVNAVPALRELALSNEKLSFSIQHARHLYENGKL